MTDLLSIRIDSKSYKKRTGVVEALEGFSLSVEPGETVAIMGESGVGKSTLLNILGLIDLRYTGSYQLFGKNARELSDDEAATWRNRRIGFVLQESALVDSMSIADNVRLPFAYAARGLREDYEARFGEITEALGIHRLLEKKPLECSGGEKSRAVFARAVLMNPELILADEPTASLDADNRIRLAELLFDLSNSSASAIITVTHDIELAKQHNRIVRLTRGV